MFMVNILFADYKPSYDTSGNVIVCTPPNYETCHTYHFTDFVKIETAVYKFKIDGKWKFFSGPWLIEIIFNY